MLQLSQGGNISILQSHRLRLFFWKRCTVLNLFFNLAKMHMILVKWMKTGVSLSSACMTVFPGDLFWVPWGLFQKLRIQKKFKPNCLFELETICKVISNCWFYNYREEIRPFYKSYSFRLRYTRFDSGH